MKQQSHPVSSSTVYTCGNCGTQIATESTKKATGKLDVCSNCHPAYTGKERKDASGERIESFNNRYKRR